jgi:hypothetical protein
MKFCVKSDCFEIETNIRDVIAGLFSRMHLLSKAVSCAEIFNSLPSHIQNGYWDLVRDHLETVSKYNYEIYGEIKNEDIDACFTIDTIEMVKQIYTKIYYLVSRIQRHYPETRLLDN